MAVGGGRRPPKSTQGGITPRLYVPQVDFHLHPLVCRMSGGGDEGRAVWHWVGDNPECFRRVWWRVRTK